MRLSVGVYVDLCCGNCCRKESAAGNFCPEQNRLQVCGEKGTKEKERREGEDGRRAKRMKVLKQGSDESMGERRFVAMKEE